MILEDCHLRLGDGTHCNIFTNEHNETPEGNTLDGTDKNISIIGRGNAVLDGGEMNDVNERIPLDKRVAPIAKRRYTVFTAYLLQFYSFMFSLTKFLRLSL